MDVRKRRTGSQGKLKTEEIRKKKKTGRVKKEKEEKEKREKSKRKKNQMVHVLKKGELR